MYLWNTSNRVSIYRGFPIDNLKTYGSLPEHMQKPSEDLVHVYKTSRFFSMKKSLEVGIKYICVEVCENIYQYKKLKSLHRGFYSSKSSRKSYAYSSTPEDIQLIGLYAPTEICGRPARGLLTTQAAFYLPISRGFAERLQLFLVLLQKTSYL